MTASYYALRYVAGTALKDRKHVFTLGRWSTYEDADEAREALPKGIRNLLEVVVR